MGRAIVTGGAGFIGSHLVDWLVRRGEFVVVLDNLSAGRAEFVQRWLREGSAKLVKCDLVEPSGWGAEFEGADAVYHLAANPDIRAGSQDRVLDIRQGAEATRNVLDAALKHAVGRFIYASTSAVYGSPSVIPTPVSYGPLLPESLYGAGKLAGEAFVSAFHFSFGLPATIFRFANVVGGRATHGVILDFVRQALETGEIKMLSDGTPTKNYIHVEDIVRGIGELALERGLGVINLGSRGATSVASIAGFVCKATGISETNVFPGQSPKGWPGDVVFMMLDTAEAEARGWKANLGSDEAVQKAIPEVMADLRTR